MIAVYAPGKIMLSGEWSVLEGAPCIVLAINKGVHAKISESEFMQIKLKDFNITTGATIDGTKIIFEKENELLSFTKSAIETALEYALSKGKKIKNFRLETKSGISVFKVNGEHMKPGFGSSAAAVVAIAGAVLKLHGIGIKTEQEKEILFKLGIIAHYIAQGKIGSGFDVAASTFGGALVYKRFSADWLSRELEGKKISEVVEENWPQLEHKNIRIPKQLITLIGFTAKSASTRELVQKVQAAKSDKPEAYRAIISSIRVVTEKLILAIEAKKNEQITSLIKENAALLRALSNLSGAGLETEQHEIMGKIAAKYGSASKFSGAGGGDCGIALCFDEKIARKISSEWKRSGIIPIGAKISERGVSAEK